MDDDALATCLAMAGQPEMIAPSLIGNGEPAPVFPQPLRDYVGCDLGEVKWAMVGGGVRQRILSTGNDRSEVARLLYIPAGERVPEHGHRGLEFTLVLAGDFRDGEVVFRRGDLEVADETVQHTPIAGEGDPCICLAVTNAPLRFKSFLPRLIQPWVKI